MGYHYLKQYSESFVKKFRCISPQSTTNFELVAKGINAYINKHLRK